MKIILDLVSVGDAYKALEAYRIVSRDAPNQKTGEQLTVLVQGQRFSVTRNQGSYTIKVLG